MHYKMKKLSAFKQQQKKVKSDTVLSLKKLNDYRAAPIKGKIPHFCYFSKYKRKLIKREGE